MVGDGLGGVCGGGLVLDLVLLEVEVVAWGGMWGCVVVGGRRGL